MLYQLWFVNGEDTKLLHEWHKPPDVEAIRQIVDIAGVGGLDCEVRVIFSLEEWFYQYHEEV